uniref:Sperm flagellar 2 n=1 Tax=Oryzias latipes TaxID=8090 RepID=A0A3P9HYK9_ORYLA
MAEMLCRWLNQELQLSKVVGINSLATDFSSGYLIGEILHKYKLQEDFNKFLEKNTSISKVNNFIRLEPSLKLLGISFNMNTAQDLMQEKQGVAAQLLFQLYDILKKRKSPEMNRSLMDVEQPRAETNLSRREHKISYRLPQVKKRDADLKLQLYSDKYHRMKDRTAARQRLQLQSQLNLQEEKIMKNTKESFTITSQCLTVSSSRGQSFPAESSLCNIKQGSKVSESGAGLTLQPNTKYMQEIRQRLKETALASERRRIRQDRFLVEQFKAQAAQQELQRDEQLVKRLTRQTKQEQRLVTQLLQIRMQKEVIRENRLFVEQQYQERREKDFREALNREAVLAQQEKAAREEEIRKDVEWCARISMERRQSKRKKHFHYCKALLNQIVDLATKVGDYRQLTENTIPEQTMRDWKELLFKGLPLYEPSHELSLELSLVFVDYYIFYIKTVCQNANNILENVVRKLKNIVSSSTVEPPSSECSPFIIKACFLGNICSGKTSCLARIAEGIKSSMQTNKMIPNNHVDQALPKSSPWLYPIHRLENLCVNKIYRHNSFSFLFFFPPFIQPSPRALLGAAVDKELKRGNAIPNELLVEIMTHAIRQVPAHSGWILDGFPSDISLAHLLEKALGGSEEEGKEVASDQTNVIADCNPPTPPPPPGPVLDVVLMLNIPDECAVRRAYRQAGMFGFLGVFWSVIVSVCTKPSLYLAEITHRIAAFRDAWPALEKWYCGKQNILVNVDADVDEDELYNKEGYPLPDLLQEIAPLLWPLWDSVCNSYVNNIKKVMQQLRSQRTVILHELSSIREGYKHCLGRSNLKQEFVCHWQKDFNSIPDDLREDDEIQPELHRRLEELCERLWDITDKCREQDDQRKAALLSDEWLEEHAAVLINSHSMLMQVAFLALSWPQKQVTFEPLSENTYIPLLEIPEVKNFHSVPSTVFLILCFLGNRAKMRLELVKRHGLVMLLSLQKRAHRTLTQMETWLQARYLAEMKRYDTITRFSLILHGWLQKLFSPFIQDGSDFYLKENSQMAASLAPPPDPDLLETPSGFMLSMGALESIHHQLSSISPSGVYSKHEPFSFSLQLREIVSLLTQANDLIDWRRFLLCASLPWPVPSLAQLLFTLQSFKVADAKETGFINEEQYLQFFFQLFADGSISPPQLDYVSMLQYFSADPDPRQGFVRALSVVLGQPLRQPSHLTHIYVELGYKPEECIPFSVLSKHPYIQVLMETSTQYLLLHFGGLLFHFIFESKNAASF